MQTPLGQGAWRLYQRWMKEQHRQMPQMNSFLHSRYYSTFIRFMKFVKKVSIPDVDSYVWFMVKNKNPPELWTNEEIYASYLEFLDRSADPIKRANTTIKTLIQIADAADCDVSEVFEVLTPAEVVQLLHERRFSPWLLLRSTTFKRFLAERVSPEQMVLIETVIRPAYWIKKFQEKPEVVQRMDIFVKELNL